MKILFTAFKGVHNTSFQLVDQTAANYILLTNSFQDWKKTFHLSVAIIA